MLLFLSLSASARCPDGVTWPDPEWPVAEPSAAQAEALEAMADFAFSSDSDGDEGAATLRTHSLLVIHRGEILYERYAHGFDATMRHVGWSVTKSALSLMVGIAEESGELALSDPLCDHIDMPQQHCGITIEHTLRFTTGLRWTESYTDQPPTVSSVANMLFGAGHRDAAAFVASHEAAVPPGTLYDYSSGDSVLLAAALAGAVEDRWGADFLWTQLFAPLGMSSAQLTRDVAGTLLGSSGMHATPRDYARMGYLALHDGCWKGEPLVAADWMARSTTPGAAFLANPINHDGTARPGLSWWLNTAAPSGTPPWEGVPEDGFAALGLGGQGVFVLPSHDLVVVRTAWDQGGSIDRGRLMRLAMAVAEAAVEEAP